MRCPTCGTSLDDAMPRPGMSRVDNETMVCARCSELEALLDVFEWRSAMRLHWQLEAAVEVMRRHAQL